MGAIKNVESAEEKDAAAAATPKASAVGLKQSKILCRICKGDHWTSKCPFKDTHQPLDEIATELKEIGLSVGDYFLVFNS